MALAVGRDITYTLARQGNEHIITAKELLPEGVEVVENLHADELVNLEYEPLFDIKEIFADEVFLISIEATHVITGSVTSYATISLDDC